MEYINKQDEESEKKPVADNQTHEIKQSGILSKTGFVLLLIVALCRVFNLYPSFIYVEIGLIVLAVILQFVDQEKTLS